MSTTIVAAKIVEEGYSAQRSWLKPLEYWYHKPRHRQTIKQQQKRCRKWYVRGVKGKTSRVCAKGIRAKHPPTNNAIAWATKHRLPTHTQAVFDTDSKPVYVDNCASVSITNSLEDVVGEPVPHRRTVGGYGSGRVISQYRITVNWKVLDNIGEPHNIVIRDALYCREARHCLMSPQQWAKQANDHAP